METPIKYDLVNEVKTANGSSIVNPSFIRSVELSPWLSAVALIYSINPCKSLIEIIKEAIMRMAIVSGLSMIICGVYTIDKALKDKESIKMKAFDDFKDISFKLSASGIKPMNIFLLDSKQNGFSKYIFRFNEGKFQDILQKKYILIPAYHKGKIYKEEVVQEHVISIPPNNEYILRFASRRKKLSEY